MLSSSSNTIIATAVKDAFFEVGRIDQTGKWLGLKVWNCKDSKCKSSCSSTNEVYWTCNVLYQGIANCTLMLIVLKTDHPFMVNWTMKSSQGLVVLNSRWTAQRVSGHGKLAVASDLDYHSRRASVSRIKVIQANALIFSGAKRWRYPYGELDFKEYTSLRGGFGN